MFSTLYLSLLVNIILKRHTPDNSLIATTFSVVVLGWADISLIAAHIASCLGFVLSKNKIIIVNTNRIRPLLPMIYVSIISHYRSLDAFVLIICRDTRAAAVEHIPFACAILDRPIIMMGVFRQLIRIWINYRSAAIAPRSLAMLNPTQITSSELYVYTCLPFSHAALTIY